MLIILRGRKNSYGKLLTAPLSTPRPTQGPTQNSTRSPRMILSKPFRSLGMLFSKVAVLATIVSRNLHKNNKTNNENLRENSRAKSADLPRSFPPSSLTSKKSAEEATSPFINFKNQLRILVKTVIPKLTIMFSIPGHVFLSL